MNRFALFMKVLSRVNSLMNSAVEGIVLTATRLPVDGQVVVAADSSVAAVKREPSSVNEIVTSLDSSGPCRAPGQRMVGTLDGSAR